MNIDIFIQRSENQTLIKVWIPEETKPLWRVAASRTRNYLGQPEVINITDERSLQLNQNWTAAQVALDDLVFMPQPAFFEFDEAHHCLTLLGATALYQQGMHMPWKNAKTFISVMAEIAFQWIPPRPKWKCKEVEEADPAIQAYRELRQKVSKGIRSFSVAEIHAIWKPMQGYQGEDEMILAERKRLGDLCAAYEIIIQAIL